MTPDRSFPLHDDITIRLPASFDVSVGEHAVTAIERSSGAAITAFVRTSAVLSAEKLAATALALAARKHASLTPEGVAQAVSGSGWQGTSQLYRNSDMPPRRVIITTAVLAHADRQQQRNLVVKVDVPDAPFVERLTFFRRLAESRLQVAVPLTLEPIAEPAPANAEPATPAVSSPPPRPVRAPSRHTAPDEADEQTLLASAARGQRTLAIAVLLTFAMRGVVNNPEVPALLGVALSAAVLLFAVSGVVKLCTGFGYSTAGKLGFMFASTVPLLNIATWIYLSIRTTRRLRAAGYSVGLFGVRR
jgi:hypothetical protein